MGRILFLNMLHRRFVPGSDRSCVLTWKKDYEIPASEQVELHQVYRAMAWLGEPLPHDQQADATPFSPRCTKDVFEERLFAVRYREVHGPREKSTDPSPLKVKEVWVDDRRYVVCLNEEQARKDRADRESIVASLREQLQRGETSLVPQIRIGRSL